MNKFFVKNIVVCIAVTLVSFMLVACGSAGSSITDDQTSVQATDNQANQYYALILFDNDNKPELAVSEDDYLSVYSIDEEGVIHTLISGLYSIAPAYYERKGIVEEWSRWNGGGDEGSYASSYYIVTKTNPYEEGRTSDFGYEYNAVYDEDGNWTGTGIISYNENGSSITEEEYKVIFERYQISEWSDNAEEKEEGRTGTKSFF